MSSQTEMSTHPQLEKGLLQMAKGTVATVRRDSYLRVYLQAFKPRISQHGHTMTGNSGLQESSRIVFYCTSQFCQ